MQSLTAGVVPRIGLRHIAVGRKNEVDAFLHDLKTVEEGGASFRFVCGKYGSGKSFLLQTIRANAMERGFVVMDADLSPERRLTGTQKQGLRTYRELLQHCAVQIRPEGGALEAVIQRWLMNVQKEIMTESGLNPIDDGYGNALKLKVMDKLEDLAGMAFGYSFLQVIQEYARAAATRDQGLKNACLRWLRGEYNTKRDAVMDLPVDSIIKDENWYDFLKLLAAFSVKAGYKGMMVFIDEGVNLYKINHKVSRENNYEKLLTMFNDTMQGKAHSIGFIFSGTPEFIYNDRRGLFSYEALKSRLSQNQFARNGFVDYQSPVISLQVLQPEEIYLLLERLRDLHGQYYGYEPALTTSQLSAFLNHVITGMGANELLTPREVSRDFLGLLNVLHQDPNSRFEDLITEDYAITAAASDPEALEGSASDDLFADIRL